MYRIHQFVILVLSISFFFSIQAFGGNDVSAKEIDSIESETVAATNESRLYITRTLGKTHKIDIPKTSGQIAGNVAMKLFVPGGGPINYPFFPFGNWGLHKQSFDLFIEENMEIKPMLSFDRKVIAHYLDVPNGKQLNFLMGMNNFSGYETDAGGIQFSLSPSYTNVLILGQQPHSVDKKKFEAYADAEEKKAIEEGYDDYSVPTGTGTWGFTLVHLAKEDASFCQRLKTKGPDKASFKQEVKAYASQFLEADNPLKYSKNFALACTAIVKATPIPKQLAKKFKARAEQAEKALYPFFDHISEDERNPEPLKLVKQRPITAE